MLVEQEGPLRIFERLRELSYKQHKDFRLFNFDCFDCLNVWVSLPVAFMFDNVLLYWLALSAGSMFVNRLWGKLE